jgi:large subunit ribosomal protein L13
MQSVRTKVIGFQRVAKVQDCLLHPPPLVWILRGSQSRVFFACKVAADCFSFDSHNERRLKSPAFPNLRPIFQDGTHMKTFSAKPHEVKREWFVVDATDKVLGRLATEIARRLRGKHKAIYTPHVDTGDFIVVTNVERLVVTGNKAEDKKYYRHSGYPGGISETNFKKMQQRFPGRALETAVKGMLPKGPLGYAMLKKLKCYAGEQHPHTAQQPKALEI